MNAPIANTVPLRAVPAPSQKYLDYLRHDRARRRNIRIAQALLLVVFLCAWEILPRMHILNPLLTSYPSALWPTFLELWNQGNLAHHIATTLSATLVGFTLSMVIGIIVAAALWWSDFLYKVLDPFLVVANAMPKIAFVPIFYLWLGSDYAVYGMAVAIAVFVTIMVVYAGFRAIDLNKVKLARTFGASRWQVLTKVVLPGSVPTLIAAVKMNIGLALVGVIVGEFQSADSGLGFLIMNGSQVFKLNIVMTAIAMLALISSVMYLVVYRIEAAVARRYG
ncbi:ABC transporter permease [Achromobacter xylosoxidans]|uniref:ABC transporter permease n=1 Tax=Achromobacter TaxID=222 RepID=UPI00047DF0F1|nr:ABC transporter permease [Achromobacter xylosoxidans]KMJ87787.1 sulfonate ABC transporter permease [Achromobacter xylosoxidans]MCH4591589.1 ABC transporter permease [Achromobacter xylosoxidans]MCZ8386149.1 ABC transporter permease [Achromobacter xylosoxidans]CUJ53098.1 Putative aliphatic sulfonates transport permease protein ssuC [Achromobacter xylosoxidans]